MPHSDLLLVHQTMLLDANLLRPVSHQVARETVHKGGDGKSPANALLRILVRLQAG